jgi:SAM-dependent methyltransferase
MDRMHPDQVNDYDRFAEAYTAEGDAGIVNAYYERPAILSLAGDVKGRRILDAGCGSGPLFEALRDRGALVAGVDKSAGMLELARRRLGSDANLQVADLANRLPFSDDAFDDVIASLVLHYLKDWGPTLAEFRRVLAPGGRLIASVDHPFAVHLSQRMQGSGLIARSRRRHQANYFETYNWTFEWIISGQKMPMSFWNRPLHAMTDSFISAGFRISVISEPLPAEEGRDVDPEGFLLLSTRPNFLFFVLEAE